MATAAGSLPDTARRDARAARCARRCGPSPRRCRCCRSRRRAAPVAAVAVLAACRARRARRRRAGGQRRVFASATTGAAGAVFHVYDRLHLDRIPRRFTVEAGKQLSDAGISEADGAYDLWVLGPNGFHRHFTGPPATSARATGDWPSPEDRPACGLRVTLRNAGSAPCSLVMTDQCLRAPTATPHDLAAGAQTLRRSAPRLERRLVRPQRDDDGRPGVEPPHCRPARDRQGVDHRSGHARPGDRSAVARRTAGALSRVSERGSRASSSAAWRPDRRAACCRSASPSPCTRPSRARRNSAVVAADDVAAGAACRRATVQQRVEEAERLAELLVEERDQAGPERRDRARAADHHVLAVDANW